MLNFAHTHYVPVLRWKQAEQQALCQLFRYKKIDSISQLTPLIELVPDKFIKENSPVDRELVIVAQGILDNWGIDPVFVDCYLLPSHIRTAGGRHPATKLFHELGNRGISAIPVTGLDRDNDYQSTIEEIIKQNNRGVSIRLWSNELVHPTLGLKLQHLLKNFNLQPNEVDLMIDYRAIDKPYSNVAEVMAKLPNLLEWRTLTFISGAFPIDLQGFTVDIHHHERYDWHTWNSVINAKPLLPRLPSYGDYTIQHPMYKSHDPGKFLNYSASIRYTHSDYWVILRGEGVFHDGSLGFSQYPAQAQLLCELAEYCGEDFSYGDAYIKERGLELEKPKIEHTGSATTWLLAGINHHITFVMQQLASLTGS